jgi:hypothetical protein
LPRTTNLIFKMSNMFNKESVIVFSFPFSGKSKRKNRTRKKSDK